MKTFFISDMHFYHTNIIKLCNRPFKDVEEMNTTMIEKWNEKVSAEDIVYILGDISWGNKKETEEVFNKLNGTKILIKGNHDRTKNMPSSLMRITDYLSESIDGKQIVMFHYPIVEWDGYFRGAIHLYGHLHNKIISEEKAYSVCAEVLNYEPCTLDEVITRNIEWRKRK